MQKANRTLCCLSCTLVWLLAGPAPAQEEPDNAVIQMIVDLLGNPDRDMRALGFQQVREGVPGQPATKTFAEMLPKLPPEVQPGLLDALGDRADPAARPAVLEMIGSDEQSVQVAALRALGALGDDSSVALLAERAASDAKSVGTAARQSLVRLRGEKVNATIVSLMGQSEPNVRVELLGVLAARNARETLPTVVDTTKDPDAAVRLAALGALRFLAEADHAPTIVAALTAAQSDAERRKAELALLAVSSRGGPKCADAIISGLAEAEAPSRIALLHVLARAGGEKALAEIVARLVDGDEAVRDEAVRMLSIWPDPAASEHLLAIAKTAQNPRHQVLAIRGLVRLASPQPQKPADLQILGQAMDLAKRPQEKRLVLGVLGGVGTPQALALATPALDDPALAEEAALATVMIAERIEEGDQNTIRAAMEKVLKTTKSPHVRKRAEKVLKSP